MSYATAASLIERFSAEEIAQRADRGMPRLVTDGMLIAAAMGGDLSVYTPEEQAALLAVLNLIEAALADADSEIDGYVATRYRVPLDPAPTVIQRLACDLARYHLYDDQVTEVIQKRRDGAVAVLRDIAAGKVSLGTTETGGSAAPAQGGLVEVIAGDRVFARRQGGGML